MKNIIDSSEPAISSDDVGVMCTFRTSRTIGSGSRN